MRRLAFTVVGMAVLAIAVAACGGTSSSPSSSSSEASGGADPPDGRPTVVAAFAPLAEVARAVGGDAVRVVTLTPPGAEPHDLELSAAQVAQIAEADLVITVPGFQPAVDEAVAQHASDRALDATAGLTLRSGEHADASGHADHADEGSVDPHVWLDPRNMATIAAQLADRLAALAPDAPVAVNAEEFASAMTALDADYRTTLAACRTKTLVVSHEAFGYLADAYGLRQVGISGITPDAEPSPARLAAVADVVRSEGVSTVYSETLVDPKTAQTLADEVGVRTAVLDPIEGIAADSTYDSAMRANLATLRQGQECR